ncbi:MAG: hypothetical protein IPF51_16340 [Dehalococcoidia bacterium]|uniref:hypothetical protein n=1 Tax=Candidatus Amarobacter glycogenicus TaxID=3140699 RepID=UPI003135D5FB|nr:hypothetical protein [Dehalococcoidia bacterium]
MTMLILVCAHRSYPRAPTFSQITGISAFGFAQVLARQRERQVGSVPSLEFWTIVSTLILLSASG